jgi:hypothetical protein
MRHKGEFAKALDALEKPELQFVRALSELRNAFVHDVRNAANSLSEHLARLDPGKFQSLRAAIAPGDEPVTIRGTSIPALQFFRDNPKFSIWLRALYLLALAYQRKDLVLRARSLAEEEARLLQVYRELMSLRREGRAPDDVARG